MTVTENVKQLNKDLINLGHGLNRAFFQKKPKQDRISVQEDYDKMPKVHTHEMPTMETGYDWCKDEYHRSESNAKPVDEIKIKLDYKVGYLEDELLLEKSKVQFAEQATVKLVNEIRDLEVKLKNSEFANRNLQAKVNKIPTLKRTIRYMMAEHLDIELGDE